jgi:hypothetical protein
MLQPVPAHAVAELAVFMVPFNVMNYLPSFYFGGVIAWIGQDILKASYGWPLRACKLLHQPINVCPACLHRGPVQVLSC